MNNQKQYEALNQFSHQIRYALKNYTPHGHRETDFSNIIIAGLGGSGIGGRILKSFITDKIAIPVEVVSDYNLPAYASPSTLLIVGSYSGNTEETLSIYNHGKETGCTMLILTSGGQLLSLAQSDQKRYFLLEGGFQPRMALGYSLTYLVQIFGELIGKDFTSDLENIALNTEQSDDYLHGAQEIFHLTEKHCDQKTIIVTDAFFEPIGTRFAQQIQENAKGEAFVNVLPEANHNVIETYIGKLPSVFVFLHSHTNERVSQRFEFLRSLLEVENNKIVEIATDGFDLFAIYEVIYRLDYYSLLVADKKGVDALNVPIIMELKGFLDSMK